MDNINVTVQQAFSMVMNFLVARFMINDVPHAAGLFGSSRTEIWWGSPETKSAFGKHPGLVKFAISTVDAITKRNGFTIEKLGFVSPEEMGYEEPAIMHLDDPGVRVSTFIIPFWETDVESAKTGLEFVIAHELGHYMFVFVYSDEQRAEWKNFEEHFADVFAEKETGLIRAEAEGILEHIMDQMHT